MIRDGKVYRNAEEVSEEYLPEGKSTQPVETAYSDITLGENEYYVLGDNRDNSKDSRDFGPVPHDAIIGELLVRFYPIEKFGAVK